MISKMFQISGTATVKRLSSYMQQCAPVFQYKSVDIMKNNSPFAAVPKTNLKIHILFFWVTGVFRGAGK